MTSPRAWMRLVLLAVVGLPGSVTVLAAPGARLYKSGPIQVAGTSVWVANPDNDSVSRIDTANADAVTEYRLPGPGPHAPHSLSVTDKGTEVWVACRDSDRVVVLSGTDGTVLATLDLPWGSGPAGIAISRDQRTALVTLYRAPGMALLDVRARTVRQVLRPVHFYAPLGVAWTEDGSAAWVTHLLSVEFGGDPFLSRFDLVDGLRMTTKLRLLSSNPKSNNALAPPYNLAEGGYLNFRGHLAQIPLASGRNEMWVPTQYENQGNEFTPDSTAQAVIRNLDLATRTLPNTNDDKLILSAVHIHDPNTSAYVGPGWNVPAAGPIDIAFDVAGDTAYLLCEQSNNLIVVPTDTPAANLTNAPPLTAIRVGWRPIGVALSPLTSLGYVANQLSRDVSVIDTVAGTELRRIATTPLTGEPYSPSVLRGAIVFHSSVDPDGLGRISANDKMACATCHPNAEHDGRHWAFDNLPGNHGVRRTTSLLGMGLTHFPGERDPRNNTWGQLHRSGDRDEVQDFEHTFQSRLMGGSGFLGPAVNPELGPANAGRDPDLDALADYLMYLPAPLRSPYRDPSGALTEAAVRGATFFMGSDYPTRPSDASCASCHVPSLGFVDRTSHDVGQSRGGNESELNNRTPPWTVNTQTLLGVWAKPPWEGISYFGANDMIDLIQDQAAQTRHGTPHRLSGRQVRDLSELVQSIDGNTTAAEIVNAKDTTPPRIVRVEPVSLTRVVVWWNEAINAGGAGDPASYQLIDMSTSTPVPVTAAAWDPQNGDRVVLSTVLPANCGDFRLSLAPSARVADLADSASGGSANLANPSDPANAHTFAIGNTLAVTLGASGYETLTIAVHDVATLSGGDWEHDSVWLWGNNRAFLRFDWTGPFQAATAVTSGADLIDASFTLEGDWGDGLQPLELRRVLVGWSEPLTEGDWNSNPTGGPTWNRRIHPNVPWNAVNAGRRTAGVDGRSPGDYDATNDLAFTPDLTIVPGALDRRTEFASPAIADAFRFWLDNPVLDYGYGFELLPGAPNDTRFRRGEDQLREHGPVLTVTYRLPVSGPAPPGEVSGLAASVPLLVVKAPGDTVRLRFEDLAPAADVYSVYAGNLGDWFSHGALACDVAALLVGGAREWTLDPGPGSRYLQVTASGPCGEGPLASGWPAGSPSCSP